MLNRVGVLVVVPALLVGCAALPEVPKEAPPECNMFQHPGTTVEWSGVGNPRALGLYPRDSPDPGQGDIYVGQGTNGPEFPPLQMFCFIPDEGLQAGTEPGSGLVPEGWEPPR